MSGQTAKIRFAAACDGLGNVARGHRPAFSGAPGTINSKMSETLAVRRQFVTPLGARPVTEAGGRPRHHREISVGTSPGRRGQFGSIVQRNARRSLHYSCPRHPPQRQHQNPQTDHRARRDPPSSPIVYSPSTPGHVISSAVFSQGWNPSRRPSRAPASTSPPAAAAGRKVTPAAPPASMSPTAKTPTRTLRFGVRRHTAATTTSMATVNAA